MRTIVAFLITVTLAHAVEVTVNPDGTATLTLSKDEADACKKEGGCTTMTLEALKAIVRQVEHRCGKDI